MGLHRAGICDRVSSVKQAMEHLYQASPTHALNTDRTESHVNKETLQRFLKDGPIALS